MPGYKKPAKKPEPPGVVLFDEARHMPMRSVSNRALLPTDKEEGSICLCIDSNTMYVFLGGAWVLLTEMTESVAAPAMKEEHIPRSSGKFGTTGHVTLKTGVSSPGISPAFTSSESAPFGVGLAGRVEKSTKMAQYKVYCVTDQKYVEVSLPAGAEVPWYCPDDPKHLIDTNLTEFIKYYIRIDDAKWDSASLVAAGPPTIAKKTPAQIAREEKRRKLKESMKKRQEDTEW